MVRLLLTLPLLFLLDSCGPPATLVTDELFRAAAPEVVSAWSQLGPWRNAALVNRPPGGNLKSVVGALKASGTDRVLVGSALTVVEWRDLRSSLPGVQFVSLGPVPGGGAALGVPRLEAWKTLARAANPGTKATVVLPADVSADEISGFEAAWKGSGGGELTKIVGFRGPGIPPSPGQVFFLAEPEAEGLLEGLDRSVSVHGNPGFNRPLGTHGLTWRIKEEGLGEFLWQAALHPDKSTQILPLETLLDRR